jgi:MFS family permease
MADNKTQDIEDVKKIQPFDNHDVEADLKQGTIEDLDEAELFLQQHGIPHSRLNELMADEEALKKLRRKVDWSLMPLLCGTYLLQYVDKQALGYSAVFDLFTTTGMTPDEYSWMASIFYFAYLVAEWPASYLTQRLPTGTVVSTFVVTWGSILCLTAACHNFTGLAICRFLLGAFEAVITPAFMLIVSQWFRRETQPARAGLFYCFNGFGAMFGGILFYGVGQAKGWAVWRTIYVLCGGMTICWGVVLFFFLPNNILTAKRYTIEERAMLIAQSARNKTGVFNRKIKWNQIREVFSDSQIWLLFFYVLLNEIINGGIANFSKLIVKGFTHDALLTTAYGIPYGACNAIFMFTGPYVASKFKNVRTIVMCVWLIPTLIAVTLFWQLPRSNKGGLLAGYYMVSDSQCNLSLHISLTYLVRILCRCPHRCSSNARLQRRWLHQANHGHSFRLFGLLYRQYHRSSWLDWLRGTYLPDRLQAHHWLCSGPSCHCYYSAFCAHPSKPSS